MEDIGVVLELEKEIQQTIFFLSHFCKLRFCIKEKCPDPTK